ncbi:hypothetical protein NPIL_587691 [Nephila pilipes]|uniref:Uncharacterized protein n=1 Tax=Nephila pilipes TaxID=299642 RepID=A0A8X6M731_NEPPI|nr:hypothetical protein NPIL_587691 [Nephila pilipes]
MAKGVVVKWGRAVPPEKAWGLHVGVYLSTKPPGRPRRSTLVRRRDEMHMEIGTLVTNHVCLKMSYEPGDGVEFHGIQVMFQDRDPSYY